MRPLPQRGVPDTGHGGASGSSLEKKLRGTASRWQLQILQDEWYDTV